MWLSELIERLENEDPDLVLQPGWHNPHSWRGSYSELAFEPKESATVADCLAAAREAMGSTYQGWKGGDYEMHGYSEVYLAEHGDIGDAMSGLLIDLLISDAKRRAGGPRMTAVPTDARFTAGQRAALERIEAAPDAEESWEARVKVVERAIDRSLDSPDWADWSPRGLAVAVVTALSEQS